MMTSFKCVVHGYMPDDRVYVYKKDRDGRQYTFKSCKDCRKEYAAAYSKRKRRGAVVYPAPKMATPLVLKTEVQPITPTKPYVCRKHGELPPAKIYTWIKKVNGKEYEARSCRKCRNAYSKRYKLLYDMKDRGPSTLSKKIGKFLHSLIRKVFG